MQARRDVVRIFRYFLERQTDNTVKYIIKNQALISNLISGYGYLIISYNNYVLIDY